MSEDGSDQGGVPEAELDRLLDLARDVARGAGELIHAGRRGSVAVSTTKSSPVDVVTALDEESERFIRAAVRGARPDDGVLGEEDGHERGSSGLTWVVDPIDGTVNFLYGIPAYAVSVAVVTGDPTRPGGWRPVVGCVHAPAQGRTYWAAAGRGSWRSDEYGEGRSLRVRPGVALDQALIGTGFGYQAPRRAHQGVVVAEILPRVRDIRRMGCASLDLCSVAAGELDGYYERGLQPWDLAAGALIATEAGALVQGLGGRPAGERMVVAGPAAIVSALSRFLEPLGADHDEPSG